MKTIALIGNPNTGKTTLFNQLTGANEYVGNWTGVTVEKKVRSLTQGDGILIDLPGTYSLIPLSKDEEVVSSFILNESFDGFLNIVDTSQLKRNLQLTIQLLETNQPLIIGLNMIDVAKKRGLSINVTKLSQKLGVPVIPLEARNKKGCNRVLAHIDQMPKATKFQEIYYGLDMEKGIQTIISSLPATEYSGRWLALQFFEGNPIIYRKLSSYLPKEELDTLYETTKQKVLSSSRFTSMQAYIFHVRSVFIQSIYDECVVEPTEEKQSFSEKIDQIATNHWTGVPMFALLMYMIFKLTFDWVGGPLSNVLSLWINGPFSNLLKQGLELIGASPLIQDVLLNGAVKGVGGILAFIPQIFILFFLISFIEDSGYMARVAVVCDRALEMIGLNGKAVIPMIIGFGCNVPAVMATRTIEQPKERLLTILLTPLMSCSARLTIYSLFVSAFFQEHRALIVFSLYLLGIFVAIGLSKLFSTFLLKHESTMFIIELPPYRMPNIKRLVQSTWDKGEEFIKKAGTFIFGGSVVIWLLGYVGPNGIDVPMNQSFLATIGSILAPILAPLGFGTWEAGAALISGFLAKEVIVSAMNIIYAEPGVTSLQEVISHYYTPLSAYSFLVFVLLYIPCLSTVAVIHREVKHFKWTAFAILYSLIIAYVLSFCIYQGGKWIGLS